MSKNDVIRGGFDQNTPIIASDIPANKAIFFDEEILFLKVKIQMTYL